MTKQERAQMASLHSTIGQVFEAEEIISKCTACNGKPFFIHYIGRIRDIKFAAALAYMMGVAEGKHLERERRNARQQ